MNPGRETVLKIDCSKIVSRSTCAFSIRPIISLSILIIIFYPVFLSNTGTGLRAQDKTEYTNPVLAGFYPDPSICRVGDDYYLVNSTFAYYPGITVFKSSDLADWKLIGYVIDRADYLNYDSLGVSRGIFAPAIRYHDGVYFVTCTFVDGGGNFVSTAKDPAGPWSKPVWLPQVSGIDPSLFFDDNGKAYLVYNSIAPDNRPLYPGHRTIRMRTFDPAKLAVLDDERILINGGTDISRKPAWIEGPHIFKVNGIYYLIAAEGGTAENHSEVVFRSDSVGGPYIPYEHNPILTQRDLSPSRPDPITCTGHADLVETQSGKWYAVFLGCRPYEDNYYNTGRETFLAPVGWKDGWPSIVPGGETVKYFFPLPVGNPATRNGLRYSGNFEFTDDFNSDSLDLNYEFLRSPRERWYSLKQRPGYLALNLRPETCSGNGNPSFIGRRQEHLDCSASTGLLFSPAAENEKAGLIVFQNETHFYFICKSFESGRPVVQLYVSPDADTSGIGMKLLSSQLIPAANEARELYLKIHARGKTYSFSYGFEPGQWTALADNIDGTFLSTKTAGGFVGCMFGLYATSQGTITDRIAYFDWFRYTGDDKIYSKGLNEK